MLAQNLQIEQTGALVVASLDVRRLSGAEADVLIEDLASRMRCDGATHFLLDMRKVEYVDSSCIGSLVTFLQDLEHVRGRLALANCQPNVAFLFKVTRLDTVFTLYDDLDQARTQILHG
ncbi:MAG: STAS domain-containing protein [Phycisphaeraceae bacterium]|nr:STAS domain-containing protein [Phycisphaeraceae bacterium]